MLLILLSILVVANVAEAKFRSTKPPVWYTNFPIWANYTEMNRTHESIKVAWEPVQNNGFHYVTEIELCPRDDEYLRSTKLALYPSGNHMNHTYFYENFLLDEYWLECQYTIHGMV